MKKILVLLSLLMTMTLFTACDLIDGNDGKNGSDGTDANVTVTLPEPIIIEPEPNIYQDTNLSSSTFWYEISNAGGTVEIKYVGLDNGGDHNFFVTHDIDGLGFNTYFPTTFLTGNLIYVNDIITIPSNDTTLEVVHTININYLTDTELITISAFDLIQNTFEDELNFEIYITNNNPIDIDLTIDTNATVVP